MCKLFNRTQVRSYICWKRYLWVLWTVHETYPRKCIHGNALLSKPTQRMCGEQRNFKRHYETGLLIWQVSTFYFVCSWSLGVKLQKTSSTVLVYSCYGINIWTIIITHLLLHNYYIVYTHYHVDKNHALKTQFQLK